MSCVIGGNLLDLSVPYLLIYKIGIWEFPDGPVLELGALTAVACRVQSLVEELKSCKLHGRTKNTN